MSGSASRVSIHQLRPGHLDGRSGKTHHEGHAQGTVIELVLLRPGIVAENVTTIAVVQGDIVAETGVRSVAETAAKSGVGTGAGTGVENEGGDVAVGVDRGADLDPEPDVAGEVPLSGPITVDNPQEKESHGTVGEVVETSVKTAGEVDQTGRATSLTGTLVSPKTTTFPKVHQTGAVQTTQTGSRRE